MITSENYIEIPKLFFRKSSEMIIKNYESHKDIQDEFTITDIVIDFENEKENYKLNIYKYYYKFEGSKLINFYSPKMQIFHFKLNGFSLSEEELIIEETILEKFQNEIIVELLIKPNKRIELFDNLVMNLNI